TIFPRAVETGTLRPIAAGTVARRTILTRTRKPRTLVAAAILARLAVARLVETPRRSFRAVIALALLPRLGFATARTVAKILARAPVWCAAREFSLAVEFAFRTVAAKLPLWPVAIARRPCPVRAIALRP